MFCRTLIFLCLGLTAGVAYAQTTAASANSAEPEDRKLLSRISGIFGGDLPQLDLPGTVKLILRPHFGDLVRRDYMRVESGLRWSLTENFEVSSEASVFFTHGLDDNAGYGVGKLRFGSKYVFEVWPHPDYETTLALNVELPTGHPPIDMTDGQYHVAPNIIVQHQLHRLPKLTSFAGMGLDIISASSIPGRWNTNQPHDDSISFTAGGVYDVGQLKWTLSAIYATTAILGDETEHFFYLQPGVLWYVPSRFTFNSKTQWILGFGVRTSWGPDGFDFSQRSRVRAEITFRQVMEKIRKRGKSDE